LKFSSVVKGTRALREASFPFDDKTIKIMLRPLTGLESAQVFADAAEYAREKKANRCESGDPIYDLAVMAYTIVASAVEPGTTDTPFFDEGVHPLLRDLGIDTISYLYEQQELWQSECSPYTRNLSAEALYEKVREVAGPGGERSFINMSPGMRWSFTLSLAKHLLASPPLKSSSSTISPDNSSPTPNTSNA